MNRDELIYEATRQQIQSLTDQLRVAHAELALMGSMARQLEDARMEVHRANQRAQGHIDTIRELVEFIRFLEGGVPNVA